MSNELIPVPFREDEVLSIEKEGVVYFTPRSVCNNLGLDWSAQLQRIKRDDMLVSGMVILTIPSENGGVQETVCLPKKYMSAWLNSINSKRVKPEIREALLAYKLECADVLDAYWNKGKAINPRMEQNAEPSLETILEAVKLAKELYGVVGARALWEKHGLTTGTEIDIPLLPPHEAAMRMERVEALFIRLMRYYMISNKFYHSDIQSGEYAPEVFSSGTSGSVTMSEFEITMENLLNKRIIRINRSGYLEFTNGIPSVL